MLYLSLSLVHLLVLAHLWGEESWLGYLALIGVRSCLKTSARRREGYAITWRLAKWRSRPSRARVWSWIYHSPSIISRYVIVPLRTVVSSLMKLIWIIKGRIHTRVFSRKGFPKENIMSLVHALYCTLLCSYWLYICSSVNALSYMIYLLKKNKKIS